MIMRQEWSRTSKYVLVLLGISVATTIIGCIVTLLKISLFSQLALFLTLGVLILSHFALMLYLAVDFYTSSFGRGRYHTHLVPVTSTRLFWGKTLYLGLTVVASTLILILCGCMSFAVQLFNVTGQWSSGWETMVHYIQLAHDRMGAGIWWWIPVAAFFIVVLPLVQVIFSVTLGAQFGVFQKMGGWGPVWMFFLSYLLLQAVAFASFSILPLGFNVFTNEWVWKSVYGMSNVQGYIPVSYIPFFVVTCGVMIWVSARVWRKLELA